MRRALLILASATALIFSGVALASHGDPNEHIDTALDLLGQAAAELEIAKADALPPVTITETVTVTETITETPSPTTVPPTTTTTVPPTSCTGIQVSAGADLVALAQANPGGTRYCLASGTYSVATPILFDRGDEWVNLSAAKVAGWTPFDEAFWAVPPQAILVSATGQPLFKYSGSGGTGQALFRGLDLSGAVDGAGGFIGQAIGGSGQNIRVELTRIHHNIGPAVASWSGQIVDSELDHNGGASGGQGGLKSVAGNASALRMFFHHNLNGVNCDFCIAQDGDGPFSVNDSRITDNNAVGLKFEVSNVPAEFGGNVLIHNNLSGQSFNGAIRILSGANIDVHDNWFDLNVVAGIQLDSDNRAIEIGGMKNVLVRNNTMNGDAIIGCGTGGVTCSGNS